MSTSTTWCLLGSVLKPETASAVTPARSSAIPVRKVGILNSQHCQGAVFCVEEEHEVASEQWMKHACADTDV